MAACPIRNHSGRVPLKNFAISGLNCAGIPLAHGWAVHIRPSRVPLIILLLVTSAARIHARTVSAPDTLTQEVNRCLRLVRIAASRREEGKGSHDSVSGGETSTRAISASS